MSHSKSDQGFSNTSPRKSDLPPRNSLMYGSRPKMTSEKSLTTNKNVPLSSIITQNMLRLAENKDKDYVKMVSGKSKTTSMLVKQGGKSERRHRDNCKNSAKLNSSKQATTLNAKKLILSPTRKDTTLTSNTKTTSKATSPKPINKKL